MACALSSSLVVTVKRDQKRYEQSFARGLVKSKLKTLGPARGTGTMTAFTPDAEIFGIDISPKMIERARSKLAERSAPRVRFAVADVAQLPEGETYDLALMLNMPPFFANVAQVVAPGGYVAWASSRGSRTPFFTSEEALRSGFERFGLRTVEAGAAGDGTYYLAERSPQGG